MSWYVVFQCLNCKHSWREPSPADVWDMVREVASPAFCPLCRARMDEGRVELLNHEIEIAAVCSATYSF